MICIWQPRYHDHKALIGVQWVRPGTNFIKFTRARELKGNVYKIECENIVKYPTQKNGRGRVYVVPMDELEQIN